jgi:putative SOS response-associated peptidase YedK
MEPKGVAENIHDKGQRRNKGLSFPGNTSATNLKAKCSFFLSQFSYQPRSNMCGRSACTLAPNEVAVIFSVMNWKDKEKYQPSYNLGPGRYLPVLRENSKGEKEIVSMKWGLVPSYSKSEKATGHLMINARSESIADKPMFSRLAKNRRCVIVADGYFEWDKTTNPKQKQPYFFRFPKSYKKFETFQDEKKNKELIKMEHAPILFAGLYDMWKNKETNEVVFTCTILTVAADKKIEWIHDRMPAILDYDQIDEWISTSTSMEHALSLIKPYSDPLEVYPVSSVVGNVRNDVPECIQPIDLEKGTPIKSKSPVKSGALDKFFKKEPKAEIKEEKKEILPRDIKKEVPIKPDPHAEVPVGSKRKRSEKKVSNDDAMNSDDDEENARPTKRSKTVAIKKERK